jgi:hypothetical protein
MAALTARRPTTRVGEPERLHKLGIKAATQVWAGGICVIDAGYLAPGRTATGLLQLGAFEQSVNNPGAAGAELVEAMEGSYKWANSTAGDQIVQADVGKDCYIVDDQTVAKTDGTGTRSRAGKVQRVDTDGVVVLMGLDV